MKIYSKKKSLSIRIFFFSVGLSLKKILNNNDNRKKNTFVLHNKCTKPYLKLKVYSNNMASQNNTHTHSEHTQQDKMSCKLLNECATRHYKMSMCVVE